MQLITSLNDEYKIRVLDEKLNKDVALTRIFQWVILVMYLVKK